MKKSVSNESFYRVALARERWLRKHPSVGGFSTWHFHVAKTVIFSEFFGFLYSDGNYQPPNPWMPDHPTAWENIKEDYDANSNPTGRSYDTRFMGFAEFWYNRLQVSLFNQGLAWDLFYNREYPTDDIIHFDDLSGFGSINNPKSFVQQQIQTCFESYFLPSIKNKL